MLTRKSFFNRELILLIAFIVLKFVLQYVLINPSYDLHRDEYLHLDQGNHLAAGYVSVPPATAFIAFLIKGLGNSFFWIKFFPALFGGLTLVVVWLIIKELNGGFYAQLLAATALTFSIILRINILFQPNSLDILCWTLVYYVLIKFIHTRQNKWLIWGGVYFAIGFLNKYNILFLTAGIVPALLLTDQRTVFKNKYLYIAAAISLILITPNLIWQYRQGFPVVHHMKELTDTQLVNSSRSDFILHQFLFFIGGIFILITAFISFFIYPPFRPYKFIFWSYVFTLLIFIYLRAKDYYSIGLYPVLIAFGSVYTGNILQYGKRYFLKSILIVLIIVMMIPPLYAIFPILNPGALQKKAKNLEALGVLKWEDGKNHSLPQDFSDMLGWKELAAKVTAIYDSVPHKENTLVICDNYGQAGAINYYTTDKSLQALSFNADYVYWFPENKNIHTIILVKTLGNEPLRPEEKPFFDSVQQLASIQDRFAREYGTRVFLLSGAKPIVKPYLLQKAEKERKSYQQ